MDKDDFVITITNGGGNSLKENEDMFLEKVMRSISSLDNVLPSNYKVILVAGPLLTNIGVPHIKLKSGELVIREYEPFMIDLMARSNLVICRGGYNSLNEVTAVGVPTICIPADMISDDQTKRTYQLTKNYLVRLTKLEELDIEIAISEMLDAAKKWEFHKPDIDIKRINKIRLAEKLLSI